MVLAMLLFKVIPFLLLLYRSLLISILSMLAIFDCNAEPF